MLNITNKTSRTALVKEILDQREGKNHTDRMHAETRAALEKCVEQAEDRAAHAERKLEIRDTDVSNLLGTIRVLSDPARPLRIRTSSIKSAGMSTALPSHNTDKL